MVNRKLLVFKFHKFLHYAGFAAMYPHMVSAGKILKISKQAIYLVFLGMVSLALGVRPLAGFVADKYKIHRALMIGGIALFISSFFPIIFVSPPKGELRIQTLLASSFQVSVCFDANENAKILFSSEICTWTCIYSNKTCKKWNLVAECNNLKKIPGFCSTSSLNQDVNISNKECSIECMKEGFSGDAETYADDDSLPLRKAMHTWQFWVFLIFGVIIILANMVAITLSDTIFLKMSNDPYLYGYQEVWGYLGYTLVYSLTGYIKRSVSEHGVINLRYNFYIMAVLLIWDIVIANNLQSATDFIKNEIRQMIPNRSTLINFLKISIPQVFWVKFPNRSASIWKDAWRPFKEPRNFVHLYFMIMAGASYHFLFVNEMRYAQDLAFSHSHEMIETISRYGEIIIISSNIYGAIPGFLFGGWIVRKIGYAHTWSVIFLLFSLRFILFAVLSNPLWVLLIQLLRAADALFFVNMMCIVDENTYFGAEATTMGIVHVSYGGIGPVLGLLIGGTAYHFSKKTTYFGFGVLYLILGVMSEVCNAVLNRYEKNRESEESQNL